LDTFKISFLMQSIQPGITLDLVDYKICSIDSTWSGLLFTWRKPIIKKSR
jgi:hypothetical protein